MLLSVLVTILFLVFPVFIIVFQDRLEYIYGFYPRFLLLSLYVIAVMCFVVTLPVSIFTCGLAFYRRNRKKAPAFRHGDKLQG